MKRDMNLIRLMALQLDADAGVTPAKANFEGYSAEEVGYHAWLMLQARLATGADITPMGAGHRQAIVTGLTWEGHEFIEAARDETRWKKAMVVVEKGGAVTLSVLTEVLKSLMRGAFGLA